MEKKEQEKNHFFLYLYLGSMGLLQIIIYIALNVLSAPDTSKNDCHAKSDCMPSRYIIDFSSSVLLND